MRQVLGPGALGRPRGIGWRGSWERVSGWGIHVTPCLIHVNVWQNPLKCCEVISLQLIKINERNKKQSHDFPDKGQSSQIYGFSSSHVLMWELDYKESWKPDNWCFWTVVLGKTLENPWDCKEIKLVNLKGNQSWIFIGRTDAEAKTAILWPPDVKNRLIRKDPDAGKDWRQEEKGMTEDEVVGCHHRLDGRVWASSGSWWWIGKPNVLHSMGSQSVGHDWVTEVN